MPPKKRRNLKRRTYEEALVFFNDSLTDHWTAHDFIDWFYALKTTYQQVPFCPSYGQANCMATGFLLKRFGKQATRLMMEGTFAFAQQIFTTATLQDIYGHLAINHFKSEKLQMLFLDGMKRMEQFLAEQQLPRWKKVPQSEWTKADYADWRAVTQPRRAIAHGKT